MSFLLILFSISNAFTLNSSTNPSLKGWANNKVQIFVNTANCPADVDVVGLLTEAIKIWNNVPTSSIEVSYGGTTTTTGTTTPPTLYCSTDYSTISGGPDEDYVPGAASVSAPNGQIVAGQIFLNNTSGQANISNYTSTQNLIVLAHEIGHLLGLGHSESMNALMYYDASARNTLSLSQDDIDGMSYLYPRNELENSEFAGCGIIGNPKPPSPGQMILILLMMSLPLLVFAKLRTSKI